MVAVGLILLFKQLPGGHTNHAHAHALTAQLLIGGDTECHLAPTCQQEQVGLTAWCVS